MTKQKTVIIGAGPVGSLAALYAAQRGDDVEIYELRGDLRDASTVPLNFTKSINLALSERGINSMRNAQVPGLIEAVLSDTIPMHGRMIHGQKNGQIFEESQAYDIHGRYIRAVDRAGLNKRLLDELDNMPNVKFFFNHKLVGADFNKNLAWFERKPSSSQSDTPASTKQPTKETEVSFDFMIGADGAHSAVRYHLMKFARVDYQQEYIDTLWCEFTISPKKNQNGDDDFKISPNHLHIWPGGDFMFIAIPSLDKSFTCTLFLPEATFKSLESSPPTTIPFFKQNFPGVIPNLISEEDIQKQFTTNPHLPLISIKCKPYHYEGSVVILGDAAHAMVPFYGQGMNAGLEDVRVLYDHIDKYKSDNTYHPHDTFHPKYKNSAEHRALALSSYTQMRHPDAHAINDLALKNYQEMRSDVRSPIYRVRKFVEERLYAYVPQLGWATQYSRVSFGNERYSDVERRAERQSRVLVSTLGVVGVSVVSLVAWMVVRSNNRRVSPVRALFASLKRIFS
ncbi:FAD/NAD(P)-binding domain-containing protein [Tothia fuscella]|uniref:Kynurenine 3-monooxygenase n=1 Tax=Tothia fuscella TaxID=1048955 RepID=A0A9P4P269_9PEZI|nr:FAD/NAD(P)-binding domain-containing protein [Tothia fuscella]